MTGAEIANALFVGSILSFATAMLAAAVDFAFSSTQTKEPEKEAVASGGGGAVISSAPPDSHQAPVNAATARTIGRFGIGLTVLGTLALIASIVVRISAAGRFPWGNMFEYTVGVAAVAMTVWLGLMQQGQVPRRMNVFATFTVTMLLGASVRYYVEAGPLVPALESPWIVIHVSAAIIASGIVTVGFIYAVLHLMKRRYDAVVSDGKTPNFPINLASRFPSAARLEKMTFRMHVFAFPLLTFGIFAGAVWAHYAWGRFWAWDPKEVWAFISWVVYAAYLHSRVSGRSLRAWAPWIAILGYAVTLFNLTAVNLVFPGLHSYSGL
ncbi:c-type cytochrome biogenesis protein CcsB [Haloglycomyces albus]|uniref:c-type cytochrome biogenesis protein CcsB n=1 Tax=Haloglycomyces albus TaxID=526067 RepID=UPI00046CD116|nr:c-type cytochrome biogenesis protein CcsB [Haloglycomyces albus]